MSRIEAAGDRLFFRYGWAKGLLNDDKGCSVRIGVQAAQDGRLHLWIDENVEAAVSFAIHIDKVLREAPSISGLQWFSYDELTRGVECGRLHPY